MKISTRIILACLFMATIGILASGGMVAWRSLNLSEQTINQRSENQLISIREIKRAQITDYFNTINNQLITFADGKLVTTAIELFSQAFSLYETELSNEDHKALEHYYEKDFSNNFLKLNADEQAQATTKFNKLSPFAKALQSSYISNNKNPIGKKNKLNQGVGDAQYHSIHNNFHRHFNFFLESFGYYDIFLVDTQGNVVYSVYKELDYATNLLTGPYVDSGLARAFNKAKNLTKGQSILEDFSPYYPSYNNAASFIATPIVSNNNTTGVLIFQMPVDKINSLMTYDNKWKDIGLGDSGETYLVGSDKLMRSQSRFLIEDKSNYLSFLANTLDTKTIALIDANSSAIGLQKINSTGVAKALTGESGFGIFKDYRGENVLSAYAPLDVLGLRWAILSELDEKESTLDIKHTEQELLLTVLWIFLILLIVASLIGWLISQSVARPIIDVITQIEKTTTNKDLTLTLNEKGSSELAMLAHSLNVFFKELQSVMRNFNESADKLSVHSEAIVSEMEHAKSSTASQSQNAESVAAAINEMSASVQGVAEQAKDAAHSVQEANDKCLETSGVASSLGNDMTLLNEHMIQVSTSINTLEQESISIGSVLDVIQGIAEQTNLLALNAAIEAARAGEQGRGFAVVADEVRTLASRTQASTEEIRRKIEALQNGTQNTVKLASEAAKMTTKGINSCALNGEMLTEVVTMIHSLNDMNLLIATAAEQQSTVTEEINVNGVDIATSAVDILEKTENTQHLSQELLNQANTLKQQLSIFKY
ncbi:methyl-accepting chemotaxis protein [Colwellia asteriadis]|uniref:Methyl-accepting chemotaxis protein n=1 Tax=Colwellia asteriadis TaxID=517723 RepID=A0ABN1LA56_9GAMM